MLTACSGLQDVELSDRVREEAAKFEYSKSLTEMRLLVLEHIKTDHSIHGEPNSSFLRDKFYEYQGDLYFQEKKLSAGAISKERIMASLQEISAKLEALERKPYDIAVDNNNEFLLAYGNEVFRLVKMGEKKTALQIYELGTVPLDESLSKGILGFFGELQSLLGGKVSSSETLDLDMGIADASRDTQKEWALLKRWDPQSAVKLRKIASKKL